MISDEEDLLSALFDRAQPGKRPSAVEVWTQQLPDWSKERFFAAAKGLEQQGYILDPSGPMLNVDLSSTARKLMAARRSPPPAQSIHIGTNSNSPIQQLGHGATGTQTVTYNTTRDDLERLAAIFREHGSELNLSPAAKREADASVKTIEAQLAQDTPNPTIVREAGKSLKTVVEGAAGNLIASGLSEPGLWQWVLSLMF